MYTEEYKAARATRTEKKAALQLLEPQYKATKQANELADQLVVALRAAGLPAEANFLRFIRPQIDVALKNLIEPYFAADTAYALAEAAFDEQVHLYELEMDAISARVKTKRKGEMPVA